MSAYATREDLAREFGEQALIDATDLGDEPTGEANEDTLTQALETATGTINSYLGRRYTLPLAAPVDPQVRGICVDLAFWRLHTTADRDHPHRQRYEDAMRLLRDFAEGKALVMLAPGPDPEAPAAARPDLPAYRTPPRTFSREAFGPWG